MTGYHRPKYAIKKRGKVTRVSTKLGLWTGVLEGNQFTAVHRFTQEKIRFKFENGWEAIDEVLPRIFAHLVRLAEAARQGAKWEQE